MQGRDLKVKVEHLRSVMSVGLRLKRNIQIVIRNTLCVFSLTRPDVTGYGDKEQPNHANV